MKITVPEKEIEVCDVCERDAYLQTCLFCKGKFCLLCEGMITGCIHRIQVCRRCAEEPAVLKIAAEYAPRLTAILNERDTVIFEAGPEA